MSRTVLIVSLLAAVLAAVGGGVLLNALSGSTAAARTLETLSPVYQVQKEFRSMMGPSSTEQLAFPSQPGEPELAWIVGYRATVVGPDGKAPVSQEFMCHANLDFDAERHALLHDLPVYHTGRLFTLSQGQQEIRLPQGFGIPYYTDEGFSLTTQVLNLNPDGQRYDLRHKVTLEYLLERDLDQPLKPLFMTSAWGLKLLEGKDGYYGIETPQLEQEGSSCLPGEVAGPDTYVDGFDRRFAGHWIVPPGREINRTLVTKILKIPYDTTVHYIAAHLHPFAESLELRDLTTGETVYQSRTEGYRDKIGLKRVDSLTSVPGVPVFADHEYELVSVYNNTTDVPQDSMAVMLLYLHDKKFKPQSRALIPASEIVEVKERPRTASDLLLLHTTFGDVLIGLYPDVAPRHVERIYELARLGVYDGVYFSRAEPQLLVQLAFPHSRVGAPLSTEQQAAIRPLRAEFSTLPAVSGSVLMALHDNSDPHSAEASFMVLLADYRSLDQKYTVVGRSVKGLDKLKAMAAAKAQDPTLNPVIDSAEIVNLEVLKAEALRQRGS